MGSLIGSMLGEFRSERREYTTIVLLFGYLFCVVCASTVGRTAADTLFLSAYDASVLSYMYLPQAAVLFICGILYQRLCRRFRTDKLVLAVILTAACLSIASRVLIGTSAFAGAILPVIYIGYDVLNFLMIVSFWQFAPAVMDQRKAKRTIGWVGSGGIAGGILAGFGLKLIAEPLGTANLIYVYAGFQLLSLLFVLSVLRKVPDRGESFGGSGKMKAGDASVPRGKGADGMRALLRDVPHLRWVALVAAALVVALTLIDFQFKSILRDNLQNEALAGFMGTFYGAAGLLAMLVQLFVSGTLITRLGVTTAMLVFPLVLLLGSTALLFVPVLAVAAIVKGSDKVLGDTVYSSVSQLMMLPIPPELRVQAKGMLDGIVRNGAKLLAAVSLIVLSQRLAPEQFSYIVLGLMAVAVTAAFRIKKSYLAMLLSTLQAKTMTLRDDADGVDLMDPASLQVLVQAMRSDDHEQALHAFRLLQDVQGFDLTPHLEWLLRHPAEPIRIAVLRHMQAATPAGGERLVEPLAASAPEEVRCEAVLALAAYAQEAYLDKLVELLRERNVRIRAAAVAGLVKHYGIEGMFHAVGALKEMLGSRDDGERVAMAGLFGTLGISSFYKPLVPLLADPHADVRAKALESAGLLRVAALVPHILPLLNDSAARQAAIKALAGYEADVILPLLKPHLIDGEAHPSLPRVFETIGTQQAFDALLDDFGRMPPAMQEQALASAVRMKGDRCRIDPAYGERLVLEEIASYWTWAVHVETLRDAGGCGEIVEAAEEARLRRLNVIFRMLSLIYEVRTIQAVQSNWMTGDARMQANAAEAMDQLLSGRLRAEMARLFANRLPARDDAAAGSPEAALEWLEPRSDDWLKLLIHEAAAGSGFCGGDSGDLRGRVRLLRGVPLFAGLPGRDLYAIAQRLERREVQAGESIVRQSEAGHSLYVIASGRVIARRHDVKVSELATGGCFGEVAVIAQGPRSATITAAEETTLYRLTSESFYETLFDRTEIAQAMMKLLSHRLRTANARIPAAALQPDAASETAAAASADGRNAEREARLGLDGGRNEALIRRLLVLQRIGLFANCAPSDYLRLAHLVRERVYEAGRPICMAGDYGDTMYGIIEGEIHVVKEGERLATLGVGQSFGEMSIIDGEPRSADCIAGSRTVLIELTRDEAEAFCFGRIDVLKGIIRALAERLRETEQLGRL